jgi:hypothetical protein
LSIENEKVKSELNKSEINLEHLKEKNLFEIEKIKKENK